MAITWNEYGKRVDALPERDRKILELARKSTNALAFALQNANNERACIKYEKQSDDAMAELYNLVLGIPGEENDEAS